MTGDSLQETKRTRLTRLRDRGRFDRSTIDQILDAMPLCHIGYILDGAPIVTPQLQWREGDRVFWHGSAASRLIRNCGGNQVSISVALLDGLVLARSAFHHSVNYRSVMLFGKAERVEDPEEKALHLSRLVEHLYPGRWESLRAMRDEELKATTVMSIPILEGSAKIRSGGPGDEEDDHKWPVWAGVMPVETRMGVPEPDPGNPPEVSIPAVAVFNTPGHARPSIRPARSHR